MVIELCVVQFWSEIILVISNQTRAARSFDFEIKRMISDQIALHSVQLPLYIISLGIRPFDDDIKTSCNWTTFKNFALNVLENKTGENRRIT